MVELLALLRLDSLSAFKLLHNATAPADAAEHYHALLRHAYWKAHDLPAVITVARAGITWCLARSLEPGTPRDHFPIRVFVRSHPL